MRNRAKTLGVLASLGLTTTLLGVAGAPAAMAAAADRPHHHHNQSRNCNATAVGIAEHHSLAVPIAIDCNLLILGHHSDEMTGGDSDEPTAGDPPAEHRHHHSSEVNCNATAVGVASHRSAAIPVAIACNVIVVHGFDLRPAEPLVPADLHRVAPIGED